MTIVAYKIEWTTPRLGSGANDWCSSDATAARLREIADQAVHYALERGEASVTISVRRLLTERQ